MFKELTSYLDSRISEFGEISTDRRSTLTLLSDHIRSKQNAGDAVRLNFICTHNSRRSHLAQVWMQTAAHYFGLEDIETFSGGTEATAFNPRAVDALRRAGFRVNDPGGDNPRYELSFSEDDTPMICFSKTFDDPANPATGFTAVMTCSDADENCPYVPGTDFRIAVTYRDPKESDGTSAEATTYDKRCRQIAREMSFVAFLLTNSSAD